MIKLTVKLPERVAVAVSGGADSMAALDFLSRKREVFVLHYNHGTDHASEAQKIVEHFCEKRDIHLLVSSLQDEVPSGMSKEDFWRKSRYNFFETVGMTPVYREIPVITCHHLDDLIETWLFTSIHGEPRLIPTKRGRYLRPFLSTRKSIFEDWCDRKDVPYINDPSNTDLSFMRNFIRHELVPKALRVNPGLPKVLRKKVINNPDVFD
tara:strand:+ start:252 stop:878 length:627 start_codon:yes stop_codon:yes gene_type:complete